MVVGNGGDGKERNGRKDIKGNLTHDKRSIPPITLSLLFNHFKFLKYLSSLSSAMSSSSPPKWTNHLTVVGAKPPNGANSPQHPTL
jgi:hypothetical protein